MKSNDNIPKDELLLAELIAAARSRNLKGCKGVLFRSRDSSIVSYNEITDSFSHNIKPVACCAMGAALLSPLKLDLTGATARGNDAYAKQCMPLLEDENEIHDWNLGAVFNIAMSGK